MGPRSVLLLAPTSQQGQQGRRDGRCFLICLVPECLPISAPEGPAVLVAAWSALGVVGFDAMVTLSECARGVVVRGARWSARGAFGLKPKLWEQSSGFGEKAL